jgi:Fur family transcriptional regulator, ferric uptake regulator
MEKKIKQAGYKMTKPRQAVLSVLEQEHYPLSAQEVYERSESARDLVSVYRTLHLFEEIGIVQREDSNGTARYYLADNSHHHVTCTDCGRTECVPCKHSFKIKGFKNISHQLTLSGTCSGCAK